MPGRSSQSTTLQYVGLVVAIVAVVGTVAFDWEWGSTDDLPPIAVAVLAVAIAVGVVLYSRMA